MRILIVGIYYSPELTGIAPYTTGLAEHWADQGHRVHVVTGIPHFPEWRPRPPATADLRKNPKIVRAGHFVPRHPTALGRLTYEATWLLSAGAKSLRESADVVVAISPALAGAVVGWLAAKKSKAKFGVVFQDLAGQAGSQSGYPGGNIFAKYAGHVEKFIAGRAQGIGIISRDFRSYLEDAGIAPGLITEVRNWTHLTTPIETRQAARRRLGWRDDEFVCLHSGNMGQKQGLDNLVDAAALLEGPGLRIVLAGDGNDREHLVAYAAKIRQDQLSFLGLQPPGSFEAMLEAADVLILSQRPTVDDMAMPSKLTSYFAAGRPVVAAVAPTSAAATEVLKARAGILVPAGNPAALSQALRALKHDPVLCTELGQNGKMYASRSLGRDRALLDYDKLLSQLEIRAASIA